MKAPLCDFALADPEESKELPTFQEQKQQDLAQANSQGWGNLVLDDESNIGQSSMPRKAQKPFDFNAIPSF